MVRKFTKPVEVELTAGTPTTGTLNGFAFHDGVTGAPMLDLAVAYVDCEVRQQVELGGHTLFVGRDRRRRLPVRRGRPRCSPWTTPA